MSIILIVEDNVKSSYLMEQFLFSRGHQVHSAANGAVALESARKYLPDVIISDIMMPVMNGFRLCRELKNDTSLKDIPIIFYTATFVDKEDERLAMHLGAFRFLIKPATEAELDAALQDALIEREEDVQSLHERSPADVENMLDMYDNSITRKLAKKVEQLQEERKALFKSEQRLKEAQEIAQIGHWEFDLKSHTFQWSDEVCRIFGLKPREAGLSHEAFLKMIHPDDRELSDKSFQNLLAQMTPYDIIYRIQIPGGADRFVHERGQTLCNDVGTPIAALGTVQNITEQKVAELELESYRNHLEKIVAERTQELHQVQDKLVQKERLEVLGKLATTVSHELRNPLGTIGNVIDLLDEAFKNRNFDRVPDKLKLANRSITRCDRIINELLEFANGKNPQTQNVVFDTWLQDSLNEINWPDSIRCELLLAADVNIPLDPSLMHRIVNNIVNNAIQSFALSDDTDKTVKILTSIEADQLNITIQDNGHGMDQECLEHIFTPLYSTKVFGVGLGMSIVKNAVESLKGSITVESTEGIGTSVKIKVPV